MDFIETFTSVGSTIVDPFSGNGDVALQAILMGRHIYASDIDPRHQLITYAKIHPVSLGEIEARLDGINLYGKITLGGDDQISTLMHHQTYRELVNIRSALMVSESDVDLFIKMIILARLYGKYRGFISNGDREYTSIRKTVLEVGHKILRSGLVEYIRENNRKSVVLGDSSRSLGFPTEGGDCLITSLPLPTKGYVTESDREKLEGWFLGIDLARVLSRKVEGMGNMMQWGDFLVSSMEEFHRILKPNGACILKMKEVSFGDISTRDITKRMSHRVGFKLECEIDDYTLMKKVA
ncbi:MAG: hypothetical protein ACUVXI_01035 [bacterium]